MDGCTNPCGSTSSSRVRCATPREGIGPTCATSFANSSAGDLITIADIGKACFIVDDQTVAKTDGTGTRSRAGIVDGIEASGGVWVRCDEALARAA